MIKNQLYENVRLIRNDIVIKNQLIDYKNVRFARNEVVITNQSFGLFCFESIKCLLILSIKDGMFLSLKIVDLR